MPEDFGYETAPDISGAERESVSTDENSALQRAIRSTQGNEGFVKDPSDLLTMGPRAFDIASEGEKERRNMLVSRAGQGISLSGQAISQRGFQKKTDSRRALEQEAEAFFRRTDGMSPSDALGEASSSEGRNPIITPSFTALDAAKIKAGAAEAVQFGQAVDKGSRASKEVLAERAKIQDKQNARGFRDMAVSLETADLKDKQAVTQAIVRSGIRDPKVGVALAEQIRKDPAKTMAVIKSLGSFSDASSKAVAAGWGDNKWKGLSARAIKSAASGVDDPQLEFEMAMNREEADQFVAEVNAKKAAEELLSESEKTQLKIDSIHDSLRKATLNVDDADGWYRPEVQAQIVGLKKDLNHQVDLKEAQQKAERADPLAKKPKAPPATPATPATPAAPAAPVIPAAPAAPVDTSRNKAASDAMGRIFRG